MKEILNKANELGLLIRETAQYRNFRDATAELEEDTASKKLLEDYSGLCGELAMRERSGDIIENFEREELDALRDEMSRNDIILCYLEARDSYIALLEKVRRELADEGNPGGSEEDRQ